MILHEEHLELQTCDSSNLTLTLLREKSCELSRSTECSTLRNNNLDIVLSGTGRDVESARCRNDRTTLCLLLLMVWICLHRDNYNKQRYAPFVLRIQ